MKFSGFRSVENAHDESIWAATWVPAINSRPAATSSASSPPPPPSTAPSASSTSTPTPPSTPSNPPVWGLLFDPKFFRNAADADIFRVIEQAIAVAAADSPDELRARRARIAEALYVCLACTCSTRRLHNHHNQEETDQNEEEEENDDRRVGSNLSYNETKALTEEIEEESHTLGEVVRIKGVLSADREQSDGVLFESLRRLQLMELSVQTLQLDGVSFESLRRLQLMELSLQTMQVRIGSNTSLTGSSS